MRLAFELRACPVVRMARDGPHHRRGAEVDAFLAACWRDPEADVDRAEVYRAWLERQIEGPPDSPLPWHGGALLRDLSLSRFRRTRLFRRSQGQHRTGRACERPDATFRGTVEVTDGERFGRLVARGVGRHRAFGFGMLLLRRLASC